MYPLTSGARAANVSGQSIGNARFVRQLIQALFAISGKVQNTLTPFI